MPVTKMKATRSTPTITLIFLLLFCALLYLSSKLKILQTGLAVYLHTISIIQMITEPREASSSRPSVLRTCWYCPATTSWYKRLQNCERTVPHQHPFAWSQRRASANPSYWPSNTAVTKASAVSEIQNKHW